MGAILGAGRAQNENAFINGGVPKIADYFPPGRFLTGLAPGMSRSSAEENSDVDL
jgi:hypothetical protein